MDPRDPMSPGSGGSRLRDVGRTVTSEAAGHIDRLKKSERTKMVVDKTVDWTAEALNDPGATADRLKEQVNRLWSEDEKVVAAKQRTKEMFENALADEEKMNKARGVSSRVFGLVERLASKGQGKVSETFGSAALKLKGLLVSEKDNKRLVENGGEVARDVWKTLSQSAGENDAFGDIKETVTRIMQRLKDVMKQLQDDKLLVEKSREEEEKRADAAEAEAFSRAKNAGADDAAAAGAAAAARELTGHVTFTTGSDGRLVVTKESGSDGSDNRLGKLATEGRGVWEDVRADAKVQKLLKEEIAPGFENLIRASVEVVCDLMSALELPRVDGIYDSPLGSVCYHVDDLKFSEFRVAPNGLRVQNRTGENGKRAGFGSTVSIEGIKTKMNDIKFAYCEHPRNWGVVDGEGLCTVKVDGAQVGISYDIVVNTPELMRLVNRGVELSKDAQKVDALKEKVKARFGGGTTNTTDPAETNSNKGSRRNSMDSFHSADGETVGSPGVSPGNSMKKHRNLSAKRKNASHADADAALDGMFGGGIFGGGGPLDEEGSDEGQSSGDSDDDYEAARENGEETSSSWGWGVDSLWGGGAAASPPEENEIAARARAEELSVPLTAEQKEKLEKHRQMLRDLLGEEFVVTEPVVELRVHATSIAVGQLDVEIGGTSAAWLYNMIALVLTQQLRGTIEERINNLTVRQLGKLSGTVEAYSAGLIKVTVVRDDDETEDEPEQSMLGSWVSGGGLGKLRKDCGDWGKGWRCSHWQPGGVIKRTPSARGEIMQADGSRELAPESVESVAAGIGSLNVVTESESDEEDDGGLAGAAAGSMF